MALVIGGVSPDFRRSKAQALGPGPIRLNSVVRSAYGIAAILAVAAAPIGGAFEPASAFNGFFGTILVVGDPGFNLRIIGVVAIDDGVRFPGIGVYVLHAFFLRS